MKIVSVTALIATFVIGIACTVSASPNVDELVKAVIAKRNQDKSDCSKYSMWSKTQQIKYDSDMNPAEVTVTKKYVLFVGGKVSDGIVSIDKAGKVFTATEIQSKVAELNEEWEKEQKDPDKKKEGSRENFVDPLNPDSTAVYNYAVAGEGDSTWQMMSDSGTSLNATGESSPKSHHYYILTANSKRNDSRYLSATYWIDSETNGILKMVWKPAKLPHFVEMLDFSMVYQPVLTGNSLVYFPNRFELKGRAGFLFFKGRFGVIEESSGYKCDPSIADSVVSKRYYYAGDAK